MSLLGWRMVLLAGECLAGGSLILLLAWLAARAARHRASLRHLIWACAFGALLVLPLLAVLLPSRDVIALAPVPVTQNVSAAPPAPQQFSAQEAAWSVFAVWVSGLFWISLQSASAAFGLHLLRRDSVAYASDCPRLASLMDGWDVRLATRAGGCGPMTWGLRHPVVLLPMSAALWPRERLEAVLLHEFAHVRRGDAFARTLSRIACAFYWPNPLVWQAARQLRDEAEIAADDAVLEAGVRASDYAGALLEVAAEWREARGIAMADRSALESRVQSVLSPTPSRTGVTSMDKAKIAGLGFAVATALALARPDIALAQDKAPLPVVPAPMPAPAAAPVAVVVPPVDPAIAPRVAHHLHLHIHAHNTRLTEEEKAKIDAAMGEVRDALDRVRPQVERAVAEAHIDREVVRVVQQSMPHVQVVVAQAMAQIQPAIHRAMVEGRVDEKVAAALARVQPEIDAAMAKAAAAAPQITVKVEGGTASSSSNAEGHWTSEKDGVSVTTDVSGDKKPHQTP